MAFADPLAVFGFGGGYGPDNIPLQSTSVAFKWNFARALKVVAGANGVPPVMRMSCTSGYTQSTDTWDGWNFSTIDKAVAVVATVGVQLLITINPTSPTSAAKVPKITNGVMVSWKAQVPAVPNRYSGPNATIKAGTVVAMGDGTNVTIPSTWPGVLYYEIWNEPNQIGSAGGALAQSPTPGSNQGRPWYDLVYIINRDALLGMKAAPSWGTYKVNAITMGGLETDFLEKTPSMSTQPWGVLDWAMSQGGFPAGFNGVSMHCYVKTDPMTAVGAASRRGVLDTIRVSIRPLMERNGFALPKKIWITEGGTGGSYSPGEGGTETADEMWNVNKPTARGVTVTSSTNKVLTDIFWGHKFGDAGAHPSQTSGHLSQPFILQNYVKKCRQLNTRDNAGIEMVCLHMFMRGYALDVHYNVITGGGTDTRYLVQADDYLEWQLARCIFEILDAATNKNSNAADPLKGILPGGTWMKAEIAGIASPTAPHAGAPVVNITAPAAGDTLIVDEQISTWGGVPLPQFSYQWKRAGVNISGANQRNYTAQVADVGLSLSCNVTATNASGTASAATPSTSPVRAASGAPTNTAPPWLSDPQGRLDDPANAARVGELMHANPGTYVPAATSYDIHWERLNSDGVTIVTV